jgi:endonuclease/exonuclease/phosphatase family metal-dependent hydrolase
VLTALDRYECALGPAREAGEKCFGNALFTRHPIRDVRRIDISTARREPRGALTATLDAAGRDVHVLATHLGLRVDERRFQVRQILDDLRAAPHALTIVMGDFNDWLPGRSVVHVLDHEFGRPPTPASFPTFWPVRSLDRIWVHPIGSLERIFVHKSAAARTASDHYPVVAEIALGG